MVLEGGNRMTRSAEELEQIFDVTSEQIQQWDEILVHGEIPGKSAGDVIRGRPLKFGEPMKTIVFKEPEGRIAAIDSRAEDLGMRRSDYLRWLIDRDLATAGVA
mgnify:CR=1 FL=1